MGIFNDLAVEQIKKERKKRENKLKRGEKLSFGDACNLLGEMLFFGATIVLLLIFLRIIIGF